MLRTVVGVMGSGIEPHDDLAAPLGRWIAGRGHDLLTGGGSGVMESVARAFCSVPGRRGISIAVLPGRVDREGRCTAPAGYPNPWIELAIFTHLALSGAQGTDPMSRNHVNVLSSTVLVALPGGEGTRSEIDLALRYGRPVVAYLGARGARLLLDARIPVAAELGEVTDFIERACRG